MWKDEGPVATRLLALLEVQSCLPQILLHESFKEVNMSTEQGWDHACFILRSLWLRILPGEAKVRACLSWGSLETVQSFLLILQVESWRLRGKE